MNQGVSLHIKSEMQTNDRKFERRNKDLFDLNAKRYQLHSCKTDRTPRNSPEMNKETSIVSTNVWWPNNNRWGVKWKMRTSRHSEHIENETEPTKARREVNKCCDIELCSFNWRGRRLCDGMMRWDALWTHPMQRTTSWVVENGFLGSAWIAFASFHLFISDAVEALSRIL